MGDLHYRRFVNLAPDVMPEVDFRKKSTALEIQSAGSLQSCSPLSVSHDSIRLITNLMQVKQTKVRCNWLACLKDSLDIKFLRVVKIEGHEICHLKFFKRDTEIL